MEFFRKTNIDFIGLRKYAFIFSLSLIILGVVSIIVRGGLNLGIDFVGGTLIQLKIEPMPSMEEVRRILVKNGLKTAQLQHFPKENEVIIRVKKGEIPLEEIQTESPVLSSQETFAAKAVSETSAVSETAVSSSGMGMVGKKLHDMFTKEFPGAQIEIVRVEIVGPAVGKQLMKQAMLALFWGLIGIMVYVGWRFEFKYSAPAVLALFHDAFITIGIFAFLNKEITVTVVAAILTLVGYSINDTIVIYDRIREKIRFFARDELGKVMNIAINDTLSRTIITSLTVIIVLLVLFFMGGEVLHDFAFALLIGVIIGTYSSIFVASPLVYEWEKRHRR